MFIMIWRHNIKVKNVKCVLKEYFLKKFTNLYVIANLWDFSFSLKSRRDV